MVAFQHFPHTCCCFELRNRYLFLQARHDKNSEYITGLNFLNPPMAKEGGGGEGHPQQVFLFFSEWEELSFAN